MRILFVVANGGYSHLYPLVPLARELVRRGHGVLVAAPTRLAAVAGDLGLEVAELDTAAKPVVPVSGAAAGSAELPSVRRARKAVARYLDDAVHQAGPLREIAVDWGADVLVRESAAWSAWLAGDLLGRPVVLFDYAPTPRRLLAGLLGDLFAAARAEVGLPPDANLSTIYGSLHLLVGPPAWFPRRAITPTTHMLAPAPVAPSEDPPTWLSDLDRSRPSVYVTLGTMFDRTPGVFEAIFQAAAALDVQVVATLGPGSDPARLAVPPGVRVERFLPQGVEEAVLARASAVVCHGGYGSILAALRHGLPILSLPVGNADDPTRLPGLAAIGVGVILAAEDRTVLAVRAALQAVLTEQRYRQAARAAAESMSALPPFTHGAILIERMAATADRDPSVVA